MNTNTVDKIMVMGIIVLLLGVLGYTIYNLDAINNLEHNIHKSLVSYENK